MSSFLPPCVAFSVISQGNVIFWRRCGWWVGQKHVQLSSMETRWMMIRGYVWLAPPPQNPPFNRLNQSVWWPVNRSVETIPLYVLSFCSSHDCFSRYCSSSIVEYFFSFIVFLSIAIFATLCFIMPLLLIKKWCPNHCLHDQMNLMMQRNVHKI